MTNLSRRGFFGLIPGAAVGGKQAIKAAADVASEGLVFGGVGGLDSTPEQGPLLPGPSTTREWALREMANFANPFYADARREEWGRVNRLDPDIAALRSMSLSARILLQSERNIARQEANQQRWFDRAVAGAFDNA